MRRLFLLLLLTGCGVSFPKEELVEDLRILNIKVDPPEVSIFRKPVLDATPEDLLSLETSTQTVTLTALVAHPDLDATFELEWIRCTDETTGGGFRRVPCGGAEKQRLGVGEPVTVAPVQLLIEDLANARAGLAEAVAGLASDPRDLFNGLRLFINLEARVASAAVDVDTERLEGTKRLVLFDPTVVALVIREARARADSGELPMIEGLDLPSLCTNADSDELAFIFRELEFYSPNSSPVYDRIQYKGPTDTATAAWGPGDEPIPLRPGEQVDLRGHRAFESIEFANVIDDNCRVLSNIEDGVYSWFTNAGELSKHTTVERLAQVVGERDLITVYTAPPSGLLERDVTNVRVWSVLRDGRGGSDHRYIDLVIRKGG